jgi:hypothetical protein
MLMWRSWSRMLCLAGGLWAVGCTDYGSYTVSWAFPPVEPAGANEPAATGCGKHGVDSIRLTGMSTEGDGAEVTTLCTNGQSFSQSVPVGTWTFTFQQLDVRGGPITPTDAQGYPVPAPTVTATIAVDTETPLAADPIVLTPRPACGDGVDNDANGMPDGRVDLDDPDCAGSLSTPAE